MTDERTAFEQWYATASAQMEGIELGWRGIAWAAWQQRAALAGVRMLNDAEVEFALDAEKVPEYPNCDSIDPLIADAIQRKFCEINGLKVMK